MRQRQHPGLHHQAEDGGFDPSAGAAGIAFDPGLDLATIPAGGIGVAQGDTFRLHSLPGSPFRIFLDFDGHATTGTAWNGYWGMPGFVSPAFSLDGAESFSTEELARIQAIWARVAASFAPFDIDVTTEDPGAAALSYAGAGDADGHGTRVVVTDEAGKPFGGIGYAGSFTWATDTPVFIYADRLSDNAKWIADAAAHEVGHALGLGHDGRIVAGVPEEYYAGHGSGVTAWAPVMGLGYDANIVQWSAGGYSGASNLEDDLAVITSRNGGVGFRADDHGDRFDTATPLGSGAGGGPTFVEAYGVISGSGARNDVDVFAFTLADGGSLDLAVTPATRAFVTGAAEPVSAGSVFTMLDVGLTLYDGALREVARFDDTARLDAEIHRAGLPGGTYYLALDGVGWGDPLATAPTGYAEYGSLGQYLLRASYDAPATVIA